MSPGGGVLKTPSFFHSRLHIFFNSNHVLKFLDFSYFVILQLLKKIWAKSVHRAQNGGTFKIAPPDFSFINLKNFRNFKDLSKNSNPHIFLIFEDIHSIFCTVTHDNDLIKWCDFRKNRTGVSPVEGCGSLRPPPGIYHVSIPQDW